MSLRLTKDPLKSRTNHFEKLMLVLIWISGCTSEIESLSSNSMASDPEPLGSYADANDDSALQATNGECKDPRGDALEHCRRDLPLVTESSSGHTFLKQIDPDQDTTRIWGPFSKE